MMCGFGDGDKGLRLEEGYHCVASLRNEEKERKAKGTEEKE